MNEATMMRYDCANMRGLLTRFPEQVEDALAIGRTAGVPWKRPAIDQIVLTGLGGSAIGGDLLRSYAAGELGVPMSVNRNYSLPASVGPRSLVIVSSYSGNTEETVAAHREAIRRKARILCITSGGETARLAERHGHPLLRIPKGLPPRAALGYSFFPLLQSLVGMKMLRERRSDLRETIALLRRKSRLYGTPGEKNPAFQIARKLYCKLPVVYSASERFDVVNLRWRGQLAENAKVLAFGHVLPEMNHNELVGWKVLRRLMGETAVVFLRDRTDHPRVRIRMDLTRDIVGQHAGNVIEASSEGRSLLARIFSLVYLGDWVSVYLAVLNGVDPTPVRVIDYLKNALSKV